MSKAPPIPKEQQSFHGMRRTPTALQDRAEHPQEAETSLREPARHDSARKAASATQYRHQSR